jgi:hypothetical protein
MARQDPDHPYGEDWVTVEYGWELTQPTGTPGEHRVLASYEVIKFKDRRRWMLMRQIPERNNAFEVVAYFKSREMADSFVEHMRKVVTKR